MSHRNLPACLVATLFSVWVPLAESQAPPCLDYEVDPRIEPWAVEEELRPLVQAEALVAVNGALYHDPEAGVWRMDVWPWETIRAGYGYPSVGPGSPDRDYHGQPQTGANSGVLVGADLVLTAKHVIPGETAQGCIDNITVVFDYGNSYPNEWQINCHPPYPCQVTIPEEDVYPCVGATIGPPGEDWAVIELDREVTGRYPLPIRRTTDALPNGTPAWLVGHPNAIPTKLEEGQITGYGSLITISHVHPLVNNSGGMGASKTGVSGGWEVLGVAKYASHVLIQACDIDPSSTPLYREWFSNTAATVSLTPAHLAANAIPPLP